MIKIFSDGACFGNPGPGAYATLIHWEDGEEKVLTSFEPNTTNNRMELMAVIAGLSFFKDPIECIVISDSQYVTKGISEWMPSWVKNNWHSKVSRKPIKNVELWKELHELLQKHHVHTEWVRGHTGHPENERCNDLAQDLIKKKL